MRIACIHFPRYVPSHVGAIYETQWELRAANKMKLILDELHESVRSPMSFEMYSCNNNVSLCVAAADDVLDLVISALYTTLATYEIKEIEDYTADLPPDIVMVTGELRLKRRDVLPIKTQPDFPYDIIYPQIPVMAKASGSDRLLSQIVVRPIPESVWHHASLWKGRISERIARTVTPRFWVKQGLKLTSYEKMALKSNTKQYLFNFRAAAYSELPQGASKEERQEIVQRLRKLIEEWGGALKILNNVNENGFYLTNVREGLRSFEPIRKRILRSPRRLCTTEIASCWMVPTLPVIPNTAQIVADKGAPPNNLPTGVGQPDVSIFGNTNFRDQNVPFGIRRYDRRRHFYILGKSGSGKSCLLQLLIKGDIENGYGCAVLDPHGDLVDEVLRIIPKHRVKDVVLFDPADSEYPPCFNPLGVEDPTTASRAALQFIDALRALIGKDWTEKIEQVLRYSMFALLRIKDVSILSLRRFLMDETYREGVLQMDQDEQVLRFWRTEFTVNSQSYEGEVSRVLTKMDRLLATDMVRNVIGQPENRFDFRKFMDTRKIVLMKISKGILGAENARFLGSLLIAKINDAAMSRADVSSESRQDFYFYIDEFQNFANQSFGEILSESRKYRLCLTLANQYLGQLPAEIRQTIFGNVGNVLAFRAGSGDAGLLAEEFKPRFSPADIMSLATQDFYLKMSIDGEVQEAFSGRTIDLETDRDAPNSARECIRHSRAEYSMQLDQIAEALAIPEHGMAQNNQ